MAKNEDLSDYSRKKRSDDGMTDYNSSLSVPLREVMDMPKSSVSSSSRRIMPRQVIEKGLDVGRNVGKKILPSSSYYKKVLGSIIPIRPVSRELDWRKVELKRMRIASRR